MFYDAELNFLKKLFAKYHLQCLIADSNSLSGWQVDLGLRTILGAEEEYHYAVWDNIKQMEERTIYRAADRFLCHYAMMRLPEPEDTIMIVGPYLSISLTHQQLVDYAEQWHILPQSFPQLETYYSSLPVLTADNPLMTALHTFIEHIWNAENSLNVLDIDLKTTDEHPHLAALDEIPAHPGITELNMSMLEQRYQFENELMQAVTLGLTHKAERILSSFTELSFTQRLADPVRNLKNYAIIMNTLLRKAAEQGGVHPLYLDKTSSSFARKIEEITSVAAAQQLMENIFISYCRLVKNHSTRKYSLPVQRAIIYIDENLRGDLTLSTLASMQNINASYLSTLFKRETGYTLTDYVNQKRIQLASRLLNSTKMQVQAIAQSCGYPDINYFSKIFKKYTNMTPLEYRKKDIKASGK